MQQILARFFPENTVEFCLRSLFPGGRLSDLPAAAAGAENQFLPSAQGRAGGDRGAVAEDLVRLVLPLEDDQRAGAGLAHVAAGGYRLTDGVLDGLPVHLGLGEFL